MVAHVWCACFSCLFRKLDSHALNPSSELINIFESFLPQLLRYPNPADPLNGEAAALLMRSPEAYSAKVKDYVRRFAKKEDADAAGEKGESDGESGSEDGSGSDEMSDMGVSDGDEEPTGQMDA